MELSLVDIPDAPKNDASPKPGPAAPAPELTGASGMESAGVPAAAPVDPFLAEAQREYELGRVDLPLWAHAIAKHDRDQPKALEFYMQSRATALRLLQRERGSAPPKPQAMVATPAPHLPLEASNDEAGAAPRKRLGILPISPKHAAIALPAVVALALGAWWLLSGPGQDPAGTAGAGSAAVVAAATKAAAPAVKAAPVAPVDPVKQLEAKMQELKAAGNWNVFVLYAAELTRMQPDNATGWRELSLGYASLRQYNDALEAGTRATQLAPDDLLVWRNLGQVNLDLKEHEAALKAYERAAAIDPADLFSQLNIGEINAQLNRLPQARAAFESVLAANPENQDAMCGAVQVAQRQGRGKDVEGIARALRAADRKCADIASATAVVAAPPVHPGATVSMSTSDAAVPVSKGPMPFTRVPASASKAR